LVGEILLWGFLVFNILLFIIPSRSWLIGHLLYYNLCDLAKLFMSHLDLFVQLFWGLYWFKRISPKRNVLLCL